MSSITANNSAALETIVIEKNQRLAKSLLWKLQRAFYEQQGVDAWSQGSVPHYITNNPYIASAYARLVIAFLRDCTSCDGKSCDVQSYDCHSPNAGNPPLLDPQQPLYILELGAGSGRFGFHFINRFLPLLKHSSLHDLPVTYVLTDLAGRNVDFWQAHPRLRPFVEAGRLDFAQYDPAKGQPLRLCVSGKTLAPGSLTNPLVVLANYFFDSIPQDAFYINDGLLCETLTTLDSNHPRLANDDPEILPHLRIRFDTRFANLDYFEEADYNHILKAYLQTLNQTYLLFPTGALDVIHNLRELSADRLMLIASDRGYFGPEALRSQGEPRLFLHNHCFSMQVNFNAMDQYIAMQGGQALITNHREEGLVTSAFLLGLNAHENTETRQAFEDAVERGGPDDFFQLKKAVEPYLADFNLDQLLSLIRLSGYDDNIFEKCFPVLMRLLPTATAAQQEQVFVTATRVWENFFPIHEPFNLAQALGRLFVALDGYHEARQCLESSISDYGPQPETLRLLRLCEDHDWLV